MLIEKKNVETTTIISLTISIISMTATTLEQYLVLPFNTLPLLLDYGKNDPIL